LFQINDLQRSRVPSDYIRSEGTRMPAKHRMIAFFAVLAMATGPLAVAPAMASNPVPRIIAGCVFNGRFISSDGYDIRPRYADGRQVDLRPFEGHGLTISGALLPGDVLIVSKLPRDLYQRP
jgi:hypothetical protein